MVWYFSCPYAIISVDSSASGDRYFIIRTAERWLQIQTSGQESARQAAFFGFDEQTGGANVADGNSRRLYQALLSAALERDIGTCEEGEKVLRFLSAVSAWPLGMAIQGTFFENDPLSDRAPEGAVDSACAWPPFGLSSRLCPVLNSMHSGNYMIDGEWILGGTILYPLACNSFEHVVGPVDEVGSGGEFGRCGVPDPGSPVAEPGLSIYTQKCFNYHGCVQSRGEEDPLCRQMFLYAVSDIVFAADCSCMDRDGDGFYSAGHCGTALDCDDDNVGVHPGVAENCSDGRDNDCNGLTDAEDPACGDRIYLIGDYYPLSQGFTWFRKGRSVHGDQASDMAVSEFVSGSEMVDGNLYIKRNEYTPTGRYSYLNESESGIDLYAVLSEHPWGGSRVSYSPLKTVYPGVLRLGATYHYGGSLAYSDSVGGTGSGVYDRSVSFEAVEGITVAAGFFPDCLRIRTVEERRIQGRLYNGTVGERQLWISRVAWLAKGIGEVRCESERIVVDDGEGRGCQETSELVRYDPMARVYRMASYYPLKSGLYLLYRATGEGGNNGAGYTFSTEIQGSETVDSHLVIKKAFVSGSSAGYSLLTATDGIRRWRKHYDQSWGSFDFFDTGNNRFFPKEMVEGALYRAEMNTSYSDSSGGTGSGWLTLETALHGVEDVMTPAGEFKACLKMTTQFSGALDGDLYNHTLSSQSESDDDTLWLAENIGPVKRIIKTTLTNDGETGVYLSSYELCQVGR